MVRKKMKMDILKKLRTTTSNKIRMMIDKSRDKKYRSSYKDINFLI